EVIAARANGMRCLGISLITNPAAGISVSPLNHDEVMPTARMPGVRLGDLVEGIVGEGRREQREGTLQQSHSSVLTSRFSLLTSHSVPHRAIALAQPRCFPDGALQVLDRVGYRCLQVVAQRQSGGDGGGEGAAGAVGGP